jgi:hypothetical protein
MPPAKIDSLADDVKSMVLGLLEQISRLTARVEELLAQNKALLARIAELEAKHGKPPKTPTRVKKARKGHPGAARALAENPDATRYIYAECCACGAALAEAAAPPHASRAACGSLIRVGALQGSCCDPSLADLSSSWGHACALAQRWPKERYPVVYCPIARRGHEREFGTRTAGSNRRALRTRRYKTLVSEDSVREAALKLVGDAGPYLTDGQVTRAQR